MLMEFIGVLDQWKLAVDLLEECFLVTNDFLLSGEDLWRGCEVKFDLGWYLLLWGVNAEDCLHRVCFQLFFPMTSIAAKLLHVFMGPDR